MERGGRGLLGSGARGLDLLHSLWALRHRSARSARLKTGPDRIFFGLFCWARTGLFSYRAWTVRAGPKWAMSGPESPLVPSRLSHEAGGCAQGGRRAPTLVGPS